MFINRRINVQIDNYIYVPSLLCAEMVWAELVMCRVGYMQSLLCAELTQHLSVYIKILNVFLQSSSIGLLPVKVLRF